MSEALAISRWRTERVERDDEVPNGLDRALLAVYGRLRPHLGLERRAMDDAAESIEAEAPRWASAVDASLDRAIDDVRKALVREGLRPPLVVRSFALVREVAARVLGLRHYRVQLLGGLAMLQGRLAEMQTGEGKTLTATLPAVTVALSGRPVHVVTVNDYLARRDGQLLAPLYRAFGLDVGIVQHGQPRAERITAYACDVTYCTNKDLVFDYLRDHLARGGRRPSAAQIARAISFSPADAPLLGRGLHYAIVDEADSVLIDEARTPLLIGEEREDACAADLYGLALEIAGALQAGVHFTLSRSERTAKLTPLGRAELAARTSGLRGWWAIRRAREELCEQALAARHLFERDRHYLVDGGKVQIVDEFTGRTLADRAWERGLHQLVECKEGCAISGERVTVARITYQRFFRRYMRLAGMTGTAREVAGELWSVYGLGVVTVPTHRSLRRTDLGVRLYRTSEEKWRAVIARVHALASEGRPVLIGTRSVAACEELGRRIGCEHIDHRLLTARQDREEAELIARAGEAARVTVATNMAGRGTDIRLGPGVAERGGLHVILTEFHESRRIDRQLFGRAGRQGDPGSFEAIVAADDELFARYAGRLSAAVRGVVTSDGVVITPLARMLRRAAQASAESRSSAVRRASVKQDRMLDRHLAFAGNAE
jgi:preprotein translocase subunit SecA